MEYVISSVVLSTMFSSTHWMNWNNATDTRKKKKWKRKKYTAQSKNWSIWNWRCVIRINCTFNKNQNKELFSYWLPVSNISQDILWWFTLFIPICFVIRTDNFPEMCAEVYVFQFRFQFYCSQLTCKSQIFMIFLVPIDFCLRFYDEYRKNRINKNNTKIDISMIYL